MKSQPTSIAIQTASGAIRSLPPEPLAELDDTLRGTVTAVGSPNYDDARSVWNGTIDTRPAMVVTCRSADDVAEAMRFARDEQIAVSLRSGGHNVAGTALRDRGLVVDLGAMRSVEVDAEARVAHVAGGALLGDVDRATQEHGLVTPTGFVSQTGLAGLLLRGGMGHTMRRFGLSCDNLLAAELVTPQGRRIRVTEASEPELMWALRGGPLDLGAVTRFELQLHPLAHDVRLIMAAFPASAGVQINRMLRDHMKAAPRELGLISFYATLPDAEELPRSVRGRDVIVLFGMFTVAPEKADETLGPLLDRADLIDDLGGWMPYVEAQRVLDEDYPDGMRYYWKSLYLDGVSDEALEVIHRFGTRRPSPETTIDLWTLGGAITDTTGEASAFPHRGSTHMVAIEANWDDPEQDDANIAWAREAFEALSPLSPGGLYVNFAGSRAEQSRAVESLYGERLEEVRAIQRRMDPVGLFTR